MKLWKFSQLDTLLWKLRRNVCKNIALGPEKTGFIINCWLPGILSRKKSWIFLVMTWRSMSVSFMLFLHIVISDKLGTPEPRNIKILTSSKADFLKHPFCNSWGKSISKKKAQLFLAILHLTISHSDSFGWSSCYSKWYSVKLIGWVVWFKRVTSVSPALKVIFREILWLFFQFFTGFISHKLNLRGLFGMQTRWQGRWPFLMLTALVLWWLVMFDLAFFSKPKSHCPHQGTLWGHKKKIWKRLIRLFCLFTLSQHKVLPYYMFPQAFFWMTQVRGLPLLSSTSCFTAL